MKALCANLVILVLVVGPAGCTPDSGGSTIIDGLLNLGGGGQQIDPLLEATAGASAVSKGDFNNDGRMDLVSVSSENQPVQLHLLNSQGAFDLLSIAGGGPLAIMNDVDAVDFNQDGRLDIAILVKDTGFVPPKDVDMPSAVILLIQGADPLDPSDWIWVAPPASCHTTPENPSCGMFLSSDTTGPTDLEIGDFNNDGLPDFAVAASEPKPEGAEEQTPHTFVLVYLNPGAASVTNPTAWNPIEAGAEVLTYSDLAVADVDSDGDDDIVAAIPDARTWNIHWLRNDNNGTTWSPVLIGEQFGGADHLDVGDMNNDGSPDVAVASSAHSLIQWFRSPGPANLAPGAPQVPWYVYNIGLLDDVQVDEESQGIEFNQLRVLNLDADSQLEVFVTGSGYAYEFQITENLYNPWSGTALFRADPVGELGRCTFHDYSGNGRPEVLVPVNRDGLTQDGLYLFAR